MPRVSILIPVYNAEKYVGKTIGSVLKQNYRDFEVLLINDGSTDGSLGILETFRKKDKRIRVFSKSNRGRGSALNFGIDKSRGKYISFLDADDIMAQNSLKIRADTLDKSKEIDLVYGDMERFWSDGRRKVRESVEFESLGQALELLKKMSQSKKLGDIAPHILCNPKPREGKAILGGSVMMRKKIFDSGIRHDESLRNAEDYDLWLQIIGAGYNLKRIPHVFFYYRIHEGQKSGNIKEVKRSIRYINKKLKQGIYFK